MKKGYIYKIINIKNNKVYVGQTIQNYKNRWSAHLSELKKNKHPNEYLQRAWNKYGEDSFKFELIEECDIDKLDEREKYWIQYYNSFNRKYGYNLDSGGNKGKIVSIEVRMKKIGKNNPMYGKKHSEEFIKKIKLINRGSSNKLTEKDVENIKIDLLSGKNQHDIAKEYNVDNTTINKIARCKNWSWVREDLNEKLLSLYSKQKEKRDKQIILLYKNGKSIKEISKIVNCDINTITRVLKKHNIPTPTEMIKQRNNNIINDYLNNIPKKEIIKKYNITPGIYKDVVSKVRNLRKEQVRKDRMEGMKVKDIAEKYGIHRTTVTEWTKDLSPRIKKKKSHESYANTEVS